MLLIIDKYLRIRFPAKLIVIYTVLSLRCLILHATL